MLIVLILMAAVLMIVLTLGLLIYSFAVKGKGEKEVDCLIVLGARVIGRKPGKHLKLRLDKAVDVLRKDPGIVAITSGGKGRDEQYPEAEVMKEYILGKVSADVTVLAEGNSFSTYENLLRSRELIGDENARVGIVTNGYHLCRAVWYAKKVGIKNPVPISAPSIKECLLSDAVRELILLLISHFYYPELRKDRQ